MSAQTAIADYRNLDDETLMAAAATATETGLAGILAEARRRDRAQHDRDWHQARDNAIREAWHLFAHNQYLAADWECRGNLLSRAGIAANIDAWSLWSGPAVRVELYASEELREFWLTNQRVTVKQYAAQERRARLEEREAARG
jgi:hypothetical protein